jgi:hypothetical protein
LALKLVYKLTKLSSHAQILSNPVTNTSTLKKKTLKLFLTPQ